MFLGFFFRFINLPCAFVQDRPPTFPPADGERFKESVAKDNKL